MVESETIIKAYACHGKHQALEQWEYEPRPLGVADIEIKISHCGICASDIHTLDSGWSSTNYPAVVGHEIVGTVTKIGTNVRTHKIGDRVGVGAQVWTCEDCDVCRGGEDQLCARRVFTYDANYEDGQISRGGYADKVRVHEHWAFRIPETMRSEVAAPLLCAGVTVYSPIKRYIAPELGSRELNVGVVGIGGLGHLAVQFASKMGAKVTAISHSQKKKDECLNKLGASAFVNINSLEQVNSASRSLDLVIVTSNHRGQPWETYLGMIKRHGRLVLLAIPEEPLSFSPAALVHYEVSVTGSLIGSKSMVQDMLDFAAKHQVAPWIEVQNMRNVNEAIQSVRDGKPRYRVVLETAGAFAQQ